MSNGAEPKNIRHLSAFLEALSLEVYAAEVQAWAVQMGAAFLEEIIENAEALADELKFKPFEKRRLLSRGQEVYQQLLENKDAVDITPKSRENCEVGVEWQPSDWCMKKWRGWEDAQAEYMQHATAYKSETSRSFVLDDDILEVGDVNDVGDGTPLFIDFEYEDWILLRFRMEMHLLLHDTYTQGCPTLDSLKACFSMYFRRPLPVKKCGMTTKDLLKTVEDTVLYSDDGPLRPKLPLSESLATLIKLMEIHRRRRKAFFEAGDELANLSFERSPPPLRRKRKHEISRDMSPAHVQDAEANAEVLEDDLGKRVQKNQGEEELADKGQLSLRKTTHWGQPPPLRSALARRPPPPPLPEGRRKRSRAGSPQTSSSRGPATSGPAIGSARESRAGHSGGEQNSREAEPIPPQLHARRLSSAPDLPRPSQPRMLKPMPCAPPALASRPQGQPTRQAAGIRTDNPAPPLPPPRARTPDPLQGIDVQPSGRQVLRAEVVGRAEVQRLFGDSLDDFADGKASDREEAMKVRVRKMLELALHSHTGEAESGQALRNAQKLMRAHNIEEADILRDVEGREKFGLHGVRLTPVDVQQKMRRNHEFWTKSLMVAVELTFDVASFMKKDRANNADFVIFYGQRVATDLAAFAYTCASNRIDWMAGMRAPPPNEVFGSGQEHDGESFSRLLRERPGYVQWVRTLEFQNGEVNDQLQRFIDYVLAAQDPTEWDQAYKEGMASRLRKQALAARKAGEAAGETTLALSSTATQRQVMERLGVKLKKGGALSSIGGFRQAHSRGRLDASTIDLGQRQLERTDDQLALSAD